MAQLPDNIVSIMMIDNSGAVVSVPVEQFIAQASSSSSQASSQPTKAVAPAQASVTNVNTETTISLSIDADENYIPKVNSDKDNLENSVLYESNRKIGINNTNPRFEFDITEGSININSVTGLNGFKLNGNNLAYANSSLNTIYLGDSVYKSININTLYLASAIETPALTYNKLLQVQPDGKIVTVPSFTAGSIIFSDGQVIAQDNSHFFWDNANNRLGVMTNTPAYTGDFNGTVRASTSIITPVIGNSAGITANNIWTYTSNVNVPLVPTAAAHAASKQYVDNTALTGLKLGASVKTVAIVNISLSGLSAVNGYTPIAGDRVLVIGQTSQLENGVYDASSSGWSRSTDSDSDTELRGYQYLVTAGTYINYRYGNTNQSTITVGSTDITYQAISAGESDPIFTASPSFGITSTNITNYGTAYSRSLTTIAFSGTTTKTLTLTKQDGSTLSDSFTFPVTSVFGRSGDVVLLSSDVSTALGYTPYNGTVNPSGFLTSITSGQITTALGYTPVTNARTITINGTTFDLSADRSWTIVAGVSSIIAGTGISVSGSGAVTIANTATLQNICNNSGSTPTTTTSLTASAFFEQSDIRYKNILGENPDIDLSSIDVIKYMRTTYEKNKIRYGYSAQQVFDICEELVHDDGISLSVNYTDLHTLKILQLEKRIAELEAKLSK